MYIYSSIFLNTKVHHKPIRTILKCNVKIVSASEPICNIIQRIVYGWHVSIEKFIYNCTVTYIYYTYIFMDVCIYEYIGINIFIFYCVDFYWVKYPVNTFGYGFIKKPVCVDKINSQRLLDSPFWF